MTRTSCFKAYDIRGRVDEDLTEDLAFDIGLAISQHLDANTVVLGRDIRASSPRLLDAVAQGVQANGAEVLDLGLCGTEEVYFATDHFGACAGIMVTASHNPVAYNGFKLVGRGAAPLPDAEFGAIRTLVEAGPPAPDARAGSRKSVNCRAAYIERVLSFIDPVAIAPLHVVVNAGNGAAGPTLDAVLDAMQAAGGRLTITRMHHDPDPTFPNGIPNPLLPENQPSTSRAVIAAGADLGIAWDGDFDRCFFFDETGGFVPGEYIVGLLAQAVLDREPRAAIVHDPRIIWNTQRTIAERGGRAVLARTGHALIKAKMREEQAAYGGEMSAHHYFREFMFCDSGMIPWLMVLAQLSATGSSLGDAVGTMASAHPSSGEINFVVSDAEAATQAVLTALKDEAQEIDWLDGLSLSAGAWRMSLRRSNTEPLLRLNVETRGDPALLREQTDRIAALIAPFQSASN